MADSGSTNDLSFSPMTYRVRFEPAGLETTVLSGDSIQTAASRAGITVEHPCGGRGICGKCTIHADGSLGNPTESEKRLIAQDAMDAGARLSCQAIIQGHVTIRVDGIPSLGATRVLTEGIGAAIIFQPRCRKIYLELTPPQLEDSIDDESRVRQAMAAMGIETRPMPPWLVGCLPAVMRENDFKVTAVTLDDAWVTLESGDTTGSFYGAAVDLGTTTVVVSLHDLNTGQELGRQGVTNRQIVYGGDVISRMTYARADEKGVQNLHRRLLETVDPVLNELCREAGIERDDIYHLVAVGNSVMMTLFHGFDPTPIAISPFIISTVRSLDRPSREIGLDLHPDAIVTTAPAIASYVGGDTVADILATEIYESPQPTLLIDIGTNAEIVLADRERIMACAAPAGPAFEGAEIRQGMRAAPGAIERVRIGQETWEIETIGDQRPVGICGSGLIDALACLRDAGVVNSGGRLLPPDLYEGPTWVQERLINDDKGLRICLWSDGTSRIELWSEDIRKLQLAKAAVKVGIRILCSEWGISVGELGGIFIAGAFGSHLSEQAMVQVDMLPKLNGKPIRFVGNTAWMGAKALLLSRNAGFRADEIRRQTQYFELSGWPEFQMEYGMSMMFNGDWST